jgi:hypothetical protein
MSFSNSGSPVPGKTTVPYPTGFPPALTGFQDLGMMLAYADREGYLYLASKTANLPDAPFEEIQLDRSWTSLDSPAIALALEWNNVFLAWTGIDNSVRLASSTDGWKEEIVIEAEASRSGPALLFADGYLFLAWTSFGGLVRIAVKRDGEDWQRINPGIRLSSKPGLAWHEGELLLLGGGGSMSILRSDNLGLSFKPLGPGGVRALGCPVAVVRGDTYHLLWADEADGALMYAVTNDPGSLSPVRYAEIAIDGSPCVADLGATLAFGWAAKGPSADALDHIALGYLPIGGSPDQTGQQRLRALRSARAQDPCSESGLIHNPASGSCVPRGGCLGGCVLSAFQSFGFGGLMLIWNPFFYAICAYKCLNRR